MRIEDVHRTDGPVDRLTYLCDEMTAPLDREENADVQAIVFLNDGERGGIQTSGYESDGEAVVALVIHLKAMLQAMGKSLEIIGIPDSPEGLDDV